MHFTLQLMIHLTVKSRGTSDGVPKDALSDPNKDVQEVEVALKGALEVALE